MKNLISPSNPIEKIIEVINNDAKKIEAKRKMSANHQKKLQSGENFNYPIENPKEKIANKQHDYVIYEDQTRQMPQERTTSKQSKNNLRLPVINIKKNQSNLEKENELVKGDVNMYKIEGKKLNMEPHATESKIKKESMDDLASKFMNIRPLKCERSPAKNQDSTIRSLKAVKQKYSIKCESQKQGVFFDQIDEGITSEKTQGERKPKTVNKRGKKESSLAKNQTVEYLAKRQYKENKSSSISQTVQVVGKKKYSVNYLDFCLFLSLLNKFNGFPTSTGTYKAYVGKGNNSILIKNTLKNRFWWNISDNDLQANLNWQQSRDNKFIQSLKPFNYVTDKNEQELKYKFLLEKPKQQKQNQRTDCIKQFTKIGFSKLLSEDEKIKYSKSAYQAQIVVQTTANVPDSANKYRLHNHFQFNWNITNKKALYYNLKKFYLATKVDPFEFIPLTFHVQVEGDAEWMRFQQYFNEKEVILLQKVEGKNKKKREKNLWIIKPGENSNQGCGIQVAETIEEIKQIIKSKQNLPNGKKRSHIIQRYLMPLLYNKRKFDIRCYIVVTSINDIVKAYWYEEGYIRTSSKQFTLKNLKNRFIHLTNDAVQKKSEDYGKYQNGNKVSFIDFQKYLEVSFPDKDYSFFEGVYPKMMKLAADSIRSVHSLLNSCRRQFTFQIFGLDFMIDEDFNTWLIQVNNNPCLQLGCPLLARIIPNMVENAFKIAVDPLFPPPRDYPKSKTMASQLFQTNKFTLIFNSRQQQQKLREYVKQIDPKNLSNIIQSDQEQDAHQEYM